MARIQVVDLPVMKELRDEQIRGVFGGAYLTWQQQSAMRMKQFESMLMALDKSRPTPAKTMSVATPASLAAQRQAQYNASIATTKPVVSVAQSIQSFFSGW